MHLSLTYLYPHIFQRRRRKKKKGPSKKFGISKRKMPETNAMQHAGLDHKNDICPLRYFNVTDVIKALKTNPCTAKPQTPKTK